MSLSMKCHECREIKRCSALPAVGEGGRAVLVYLCSPCKRDYLEDQRYALEIEEGGEA